MARLRRFLLPIALALLAAGAWWIWRARANSASSQVKYSTTPAERGRLTAKVTASGTLSALVTVQVGSQVSGRLQHIYVDFNSPVKKGQVIARIDPQFFGAAVEQARANFAAGQSNAAKARIELEQAKRQLARSKTLAEQHLISQADLDTAQTAADAATAGVAAAEAAVGQHKAMLHQAQLNLDYTTITSPIDGVVISRSVDVGKLAAKMEAYFTVDAYPTERFRGAVRQIRNAPTTVQNVVTYDAVIDVSNEDLRLRPGMTANVTFPYADRQDVLKVSNAALRFRPPADLVPVPDAGSTPRPTRDARTQTQRTIWVLRGDRPVPVSVKTGISDGTVTEIVEGEVQVGDLVISDAQTPAKAPPTTSAPPLRRGI